MKIRLLILTLLTIGCSRLEQNDLIEEKELGKTTAGTIIYKLYQTGIDSYRYEFYTVDRGDTVGIFDSFLNNGIYNGIRFIVQENNDTIKIKSTRDLGHLTKRIDDRVFVFQIKIEPFLDLGATVNGESGKVPRLMLYDDSISRLSDIEISIHKKIWEAVEVDSIAKDLRNKDIKTFTFIEQYPSTTADNYLVRFGQVWDEELTTISYYQVNSKTGQVDKISGEDLK